VLYLSVETIAITDLDMCLGGRIPMPKCSFYEICKRDVEGNLEEGLCILHSRDQTKDESGFAEALEEHRKERGDNFLYMVFPKKVDFSQAKFIKKVDFRGAGFPQGAFFSGATFAQGADFRGAIFTLVSVPPAKRVACWVGPSQRRLVAVKISPPDL